MRRPDFIVAGTQKSATTWLFECLAEHPDVFVPPQKEVHYFCPGDCRQSTHEKGLDWYLSLFPDGGHACAGELTTDYMFYDGVAEQLHDLNPALKLIFLLRHPVDRAYSAYWMERKYRSGLAPFSEAVETRPAYLQRGLYHRQIERFRTFFPDAQIRIYIYEELQADPVGFLADLFAFLGVAPDFRPRVAESRVGGSADLGPIVGFVLYKLVSPVINLPGIHELWRMLRGRVPIREMVLGLLSRRQRKQDGPAYEALDTETRARLLRYFADENERLFALLGRDIPQWRS